VEGEGVPAQQKAAGSWIHVDSMSTLHCLPGNCISCDDAAGQDLIQEPLLPEGFVNILGRGGAMKQNRADKASSTRGPPRNATCDGGSKECLTWERQVIGTCCRLGHHGTLCAICKDGWIKAKGLCMPCQSFDYIKLFLMIAAYVGLCVFFWRKASRLKKPADVDENAQSAAISIVTFFFQTVLVLQIDVGVDVGVSFLNLEPDDPSPGNKEPEGRCLSTPNFYVNWVAKFSVPLLMVAAALLLCLTTRAKAHEVSRPPRCEFFRRA
jgi:hypothetical protein